MSQAINKCIDFTGTFEDFEIYNGFCQAVIDSLREQKPAVDEPLVLVVDRGYNLGDRSAIVVSDHLNLTGGSPLGGPNDPGGPRFPVVNNIYFLPRPENLAKANVEQGVVAGLKPGTEPTEAEIAMIAKLGAEFFSYNMAQTMLVAAHAGWKVIAFLVAANSPEKSAHVKELITNFLALEDLKIESSALTRRAFNVVGN